MTLMVPALRTAAVDCQNELVRFNLNLVAAELEDAIAAFRTAPTEDNLRRMVGHWAHGQLMKGHAQCKTNAPAEVAAPIPIC